MKKTLFTSLADYLEHGPETQQKLAARLRISQSAVSRAKWGKGSYRLLKRIAEKTGVPLESFASSKAA